MGGGKVHQTSQANGHVQANPVVMGGGSMMIGGNVGNGPVTTQHSGGAKGAGVKVDVSMPMPMPVMMNLDEFDLMNLDELNLMNLNQPTTAIVASPEEAMMLLNLNSQLDQPYEIKGAYLI